MACIAIILDVEDPWRRASHHWAIHRPTVAQLLGAVFFALVEFHCRAVSSISPQCVCSHQTNAEEIRQHHHSSDAVEYTTSRRNRATSSQARTRGSAAWRHIPKMPGRGVNKIKLPQENKQRRKIRLSPRYPRRGTGGSQMQRKRWESWLWSELERSAKNGRWAIRTRDSGVGGAQTSDGGPSWPIWQRHETFSAFVVTMSYSN
ncbi:hypothetical protein HDV63DRAFT_266187 [Trichoderma sp. SZMC 28014]